MYFTIEGPISPPLTGRNFKVTENESHFNVLTREIVLKIPVSNPDFHEKSIFNFSTETCKTILIHISDSTNIPRIDEDSPCYLEGTINFNEIGDSLITGTPFDLDEDDIMLHVIVLNDNSCIDNSNVIQETRDARHNLFPECFEEEINLIQDLKVLMKDQPPYILKCFFPESEPKEYAGGVII